MIVRMMSTSLITWTIAVSAALAQPAVTSADLFIDLDKYVGKEVILTDARVHDAGNSGAFANSGGVYFWISPEGIDRETFRYFLKNCSGSSFGVPACEKVRLLVTPTGKKSSNVPTLINVKIIQ
jgi:hypothetical protein